MSYFLDTAVARNIIFNEYFLFGKFIKCQCRFIWLQSHGKSEFFIQGGLLEISRLSLGDNVEGELI